MPRLLCGKESFLQFKTKAYVKHFCEIVLNLNKWFRRCRLKIFLFYSSDGTFVKGSRTICAILVEGIMGTKSVKLF